ncbi:uncharacterized protein LOC101863196 [Aplysia californica]|uniref:Uncharacterized protein LOC101863196 n=1 Tax=Aplysia californica TaxID=6500 RepID=A0ABM0JTX8_APLCA|nr:uncharacterized protein LOC101863196 [Aplysia californica]
MKQIFQRSHIAIRWFFFLWLLAHTSDGEQRCSEFSSPKKITIFTDDLKYVKYPENRKQYRPDQLCDWWIEAEDDDDVITITVVSSSIEGRDVRSQCNKDYVNIFDVKDDSQVFLGRFCSRDQDLTFTSTGPKMVVRFMSDANFQYSGFEASFSAVPGGDDSDSDDDSDNVIHLAVTIPLAGLVVAIVMVFAIFVFRYQRRKAAARGALQERESERRPTSRQLASPRGAMGTSSSSDTRPFVMPDVPLPAYSRLETPRASLQVAMPSQGPHSVPFPRQERSQTPPPAYDAIAYGNPYSEPEGVPTTPPPYEEVVRGTQQALNYR